MGSLRDVFRGLDEDGDGRLSRDDLRRAALRLRWGWHEAPLYAVLDLFTLSAPLSETAFTHVMTSIAADPFGPYGAVLLDNQWGRGAPDSASAADRDASGPDGANDAKPAAEAGALDDGLDALASQIESAAGSEAAAAYRVLVGGLAPPVLEVEVCRSALLVIDPQRSFTEGAWMRSIGPGGEADVEPIRLAFHRCARSLAALRGRVEFMCTRCPFPPASYDWHEAVAAAVGPRQPYFLKPGNSALWPPTNGFTLWLEDLLGRGGDTIVLAGCTLNSCVRVTAVETAARFAGAGLRVLVDLGLSAARASNYAPSPLFAGVSPVEAAVREMAASGVLLAPRVAWI